MPAVPGLDDHGEFGWYHTFDFPDGTTTQGLWDLRDLVGKLPIPETLEGKDCIDVAAADGYWSFEMSRRGARRVVSTDLDDHAVQDWQGVSHYNLPPFEKPGRAFRAFSAAKKQFDMPSVERVDVSAYDLDPDVHGEFDFAFMGNILLHLADPARAVRAVRGVLRPGGQLLSLEPVSIPLSLVSRKRALGHLFDSDAPRWWTPNHAGHLRLLEAGGLKIVDYGFPIFEKMGQWRDRLPGSVPRDWESWHFWLFARPFGLPTSWALAEPRQPAEAGAPQGAVGLAPRPPRIRSRRRFRR